MFKLQFIGERKGGFTPLIPTWSPFEKGLQDLLKLSKALSNNPF